MSFAQTCARIKEINEPRNNASHIDAGEMIDYEFGQPPDPYARSEELFGKLKIARRVLSRIEQETSAKPPEVMGFYL